MPPMNSPAETVAEIVDQSPYLEQLAQLASPVPDFAATLMTQAEQDANDDNVSFLRTQQLLASSTSTRALGRLTPSRATGDGSVIVIDSESRRRMRRAVNAVTAHRRYTPAQLQQLADSHDLIYADHLSDQQQLGYHGWAPGNSDDEEEAVNAPQPSAHVYSERVIRRNAMGLISYPEPRPQSGRNPLEQSHFVEDGVGGAPILTESSLRTTALLQSVRRNSQFSTRSRSQLQSFLQNRERTGHEPEDRERAYPQQLSRASQELLQEHQHQGARRQPETYRQRYLETSSTGLTGEKRWLDEAIKYLERLRFCESYQESLLSAAAGGFVRGEFFSHNHEDFILDTTTIEPPPESSWLKVGGILSGSQHAATGSSLPASHLPPQAEHAGANYRVLQGNGPTPGVTLTSSPIPPTLNPQSNHPSPFPFSHTCPLECDERWPVKVTIHSIDYTTMTLTGTMEAFNVPDKSSPTHESSITTFLEGEIIDFNKYTLETKSFNANPRVDGTYWRKLPPFKELTDDEIVRNLVSKRWLREELGMKWILMRWKGKSKTFFYFSTITMPNADGFSYSEKCFITPSDAQSSLTISGFYYVSLRREDGHVEGLYYDPSSTPYQHLSLMPEKRTFPAYEFR